MGARRVGLFGASFPDRPQHNRGLFALRGGRRYHHREPDAAALRRHQRDGAGQQSERDRGRADPGLIRGLQRGRYLGW